jgi:hypothetical protein
MGSLTIHAPHVLCAWHGFRREPVIPALFGDGPGAIGRLRWVKSFELLDSYSLRRSYLPGGPIPAEEARQSSVRITVARGCDGAGSC